MNGSLVLSDHKLKTTHARLLCIEFLSAQSQPVTSREIIEHLQSQGKTDRVTVFRILNTLVSHGIVRKIDFGEDGARYEMMGDDHHHLVCERCGRIETVDACTIGVMERQISQTHQFRVSRHSLEFFGLCAKCQKKT